MDEREGRPRSAIGAASAGVLTAIAFVWCWATLTPAWTDTQRLDDVLAGRGTFGPDLGQAVAPLVLLVAGWVAGWLGWLLVVERRLPERGPLFGRQPVARAIPAATVCLLVAAVGRLAGHEWSPWQQRIVDAGASSAVIRSFSPLDLAMGLTVVGLSWLVISGMFWAGSVLRMDDSDEPTGELAPDPAWDARLRRATSAGRRRPLFRDDG